MLATEVIELADDYELNMKDENAAKAKHWDLYMLRCGDDSLYTGITTDVQRRLSEHLNHDKKNKGAKALRGKQPLTLVYQLVTGNRSEASKLEYKIKQLAKTDKEKLINLNYDLFEVRAWLENTQGND